MKHEYWSKKLPCQHLMVLFMSVRVSALIEPFWGWDTRNLRKTRGEISAKKSRWRNRDEEILTTEYDTLCKPSTPCNQTRKHETSTKKSRPRNTTHYGIPTVNFLVNTFRCCLCPLGCPHSNRALLEGGARGISEKRRNRRRNLNEKK